MDKTTFGKAPAAMYLAHLLMSNPDAALQRKVSRTLTQNRRVLAELTSAHLKGEISLTVFGVMLDMISKRHQTEVAEVLWKVNEHIAHLVVNVLEGEVKSLKRRLQSLTPIRRRAARNQYMLTPDLSDADIDENRVELLRARSKQYLARHGKVDTLY